MQGEFLSPSGGRVNPSRWEVEVVPGRGPGRAGGSLDRAAWGEDPDSEGEGDLPTQCWVNGGKVPFTVAAVRHRSSRTCPWSGGEGEVIILPNAQ